MEFHHTQLAQGDRVSPDPWSVKASSRLIEVFQKTASGGSPYLFVEDASGNPVGLLAAEDILRRVTDPDPGEFTRWMDMPAEAALQSRFDVPAARPTAASCQAHTQVCRDGVLLGVITDDDVLVSWRSIQKTLRTSQGDGVTGLPNRLAFDQHLAAEINRAARSGQSVGVILVDLDYFKQINDQWGHGAGDQALAAVAETLRSSLRSYDMVARFGGDEFAVVCGGCRTGEIDIVMRRLRENIMQRRADAAADLPVPSVSMGAAVAHSAGEIQSVERLVAAADEALYCAKKSGRNCAFKREIGLGLSGDCVFVEDRYSQSPESKPGIRETEAHAG